jgi:hypothetical protein
MDPDPTHLLAIVNKNNFLTQHISDKKFLWRQINATGDQKEEIYVHKAYYKAYYFQCINIILWRIGQIRICENFFTDPEIREAQK